MAKASPAEQLRLLDLQALDAKLNKLKRHAQQVSGDPALVSAAERTAEAEAALVALNTEVSDVERELERAENDVQVVTARMQRDQARLDSGTGSPKDLTALQHELGTLGKRRSDLEDAELEVMERLEALKTRQAAQQEQADAVRAEQARLEAARDEELAAVEAERATVAQERAALAADIEPGLLAVYEKTLAHRGVGAARLFHGTSEGSGMQLSPGDLAEIRKAADDAVVFCPDSGCILVRSAEWGS